MLIASTAICRPIAFMNGTGDVLVNSKTARTILGGISHMTLHRWSYGLNERCRDKIIKPLAGFPAPIVISGRRYWRRSELDKFIADRAAMSAPAA